MKKVFFGRIFNQFAVVVVTLEERSSERYNLILDLDPSFKSSGHSFSLSVPVMGNFHKN